MAKRPDDRFATANEMAEALRGRSEPTRGERRFSALIGLGVVVAFLVIVVAILGSRDGETGDTPPPTRSPTTVTIPLNSLVQVDPTTGEIVSDPTGIPIASDNSPQIEVGEGGVWVLIGPNVVHVAPTDGTIVGNVYLGDLPRTAFDSIAVGFRTVWIGAHPGIARINPADNRTLRSVRLNPPGVVRETHVALGAGSAWGVTTDARLTRIDPQTGATKGTAHVGQSASGLASGFDALWVTDDFRGELTRIDPETFHTDTAISLAGDLDAIAVGADSVWVLDSSAGLVTPVDPFTGSVGSPIRVGIAPTDIAVGLGAVWVTNNGDGTISKIDPVTGSVETIEIGAPVAAVAVDEQGGVLWIAVAQVSST